MTPFYCKKRRETMEEACADCEDCPGSGERPEVNSFRKQAMRIEDVFDVLGGLAHGDRGA